MSPDQDVRLTALMRRAQAGDEAAYADLLTDLATLAQRFVRARAGQVSWLDDAVQATLLSVDRARHTFDADRTLAPWFYAIARRRVVDLQRQHGRIARTEVAMDVVPDRAREPIASGARDVDLAAVQQALAQLPARQRDIVQAIQLRDEPTRSIAARLDMSPSAVKVAAHRAYKVLRRLLAGASGTARDGAGRIDQR